MSSFDTKKFIQEIEKNGVLWKSPANGQVKIEDLKQKAWEEIGEAMFANWNNSNQITKEARVREMRLLWKNIESKFYFDFKRGLLEGKRGRKYKEIMSFLLLAGGDRQGELTSKNKEKMRQEKTKDSPVKKPKATRKKSEKAIGLIPVVSTLDELKDEEDIDEDASFFKAMLPVIKKFNDQQRLDFRLEVLQAVKKVREQPRTLKMPGENIAVRRH